MYNIKSKGQIHYKPRGIHQNEHELSLDVTGRQVVFRIETALSDW